MTQSTHTDRDGLARLWRDSVAVIEAGQSPSGAYLASPTFGVYRYCWLRDGSFIADAMSRVGKIESAERFFDWCARVLVTRADRIEAQLRQAAAGETVPVEEMLHCRYTVDGDEAPEGWWNFQLDGYGTWLWALGAHAERHAAPLERHRDGIDLCVRYLGAFWSLPSYDWWEENMGHQHTSTLAALYAGLDAAASWTMLAPATREIALRTAATVRDEVLGRGVHDGRLAKWLDGDGVDGSLTACIVPFGLVRPDEPIAHATVQAVEGALAAGGVYRYPEDTYFGGGRWLLLSAFLGWYYAETGRIDEASAQLAWIAAQADDDGHLPEQVSDKLLFPERYDEWERRWGPVASPLLWSHAMFLTLASVLGFGVETAVHV